MKNIFSIAESVFESKNFRRINCKFEDDISDCLAKDLSLDSSKWETEVNISGEKSDRSKYEERIDLCLKNEDCSEISSSIEVKLFEQYHSKCNGHFFPYFFYNNTPPNITIFNGCPEKNIKNLNCFSENSINHKEEGQLFKDITKMLKFEKSRTFPNSLHSKYVLIYFITNEESSIVHNFDHIKNQLNCLFKQFDKISASLGDYTVSKDAGVITAKYIPFSISGYYKTIGKKNVGRCCKDQIDTTKKIEKHISLVLLKFDSGENPSFKLTNKNNV